MADNIGQSRFKIIPTTANKLSKNCRKLFKILPKWRLIAESCHTVAGAYASFASE